MGPSKLNVMPLFEIGPLEPRYSEWLVFEGISVDEGGRQHYLDATVSYKRAVLSAIHYLSKFGYTPEQVRARMCCMHNAAGHSFDRLHGFCSQPPARVRCHSQVYLLLSCCPCEARISGIVDVPNAAVTLAIPTGACGRARWLAHMLCAAHTCPSSHLLPAVLLLLPPSPSAATHTASHL